MEFVPCGDLSNVFKTGNGVPSFKWRIKMIVDIACGMRYKKTASDLWLLIFCRYLHLQAPPICHSDLRVPNIFVCGVFTMLPSDCQQFVFWDCLLISENLCCSTVS